MDYIEINFEIEPLHPYDDILTAELAELGFESFVNSEKGLQAYIQHNLFDVTKFDTLLAHYKAHDCKLAYEQKLIPAQNWNATWESNFEPIEVNGVCRVRAPFHEKNSAFTYDIVIEPKMSFGTGHHETTFMMLQQLLSLDLKNKSLLDMGCGTSVLAILASKLQAKPVHAIDNDTWSYENSIENCERNNATEIVVKLGDASLLQEQQFNFILANINRNILLNDLPLYYNSLTSEGELLISGFFLVDCPLLIEATANLGLKKKHKLVKNNWALLHFKK